MESAEVTEAEEAGEERGEQGGGPEHLETAAWWIDRDDDSFERELHAEALDGIAEKVDEEAGPFGGDETEGIPEEEIERGLHGEREQEEAELTGLPVHASEESDGGEGGNGTEKWREEEDPDGVNDDGDFGEAEIRGVTVLKGESDCQSERNEAKRLPAAIAEAEPIPVENWEKGGDQGDDGEEFSGFHEGSGGAFAAWLSWGGEAC